MDPFVFIDKNNISHELCDTIVSMEYDSDIPLYPDESSPWFSINNILIPNISIAIGDFVDEYSLDMYNMENIMQHSEFLQDSMNIYKNMEDRYQNDFKIIENNQSSLSYLWCLGPSADIIIGKSYKIFLEKGDLVLFPASWEYPYKLDPTGIYLKGVLYTLYG
jgi:hypothetical protein